MEFRTIKITTGMTMEYEIISTNAPDSVIHRQLKANSRNQENLESIDNPYNIIQASGYVVKVIGNQDDFDCNEVVIDVEFDYCDYYEDGNMEKYFSQWFDIITETEAKKMWENGNKGFLVLRSDGTECYADCFDSWEEIIKTFPDALFGEEKWQI